MPAVTGATKLAEVTDILDKLRADLEDNNLSPNQRDAYLERLKVFGRDPKDADSIFAKEGIETLSRHAFETDSRNTSRNALRCLANALLLKPETRQTFIDLECAPKACGILKNNNSDDEFLSSRILLLITYAPKLDVENLIDHHQLAENVCTNLGRHATSSSGEKQSQISSPMDEMALTETLKLLFNLTHFCPQRSTSFTPALPYILALLHKQTPPSTKPLESVVGQLVNAFINLPLDLEDSKAHFFPKESENMHVVRLVQLLDNSTKTYADKELDQVLPPLIAFLRRIYQLAPASVKKDLQKSLLPSAEDRAEVLGKGDSLPSRLLRLTNNALTPSLRENVSRLLYELSDEDATSFVQNVGYGFASGFLFQNKITIPVDAMETHNITESAGSSAQSNQQRNAEGQVNPITGQFLDKEVKLPEIKMTQEEKEREAERLFVLFERLKKTGVMNVENPVVKAYQEGRFEELPDDDDD